MKKICVSCMIELLKPIENDEVAKAVLISTTSAVTSGETCEMEHYTAQEQIVRAMLRDRGESDDLVALNDRLTQEYQARM